MIYYGIVENIKDEHHGEYGADTDVVRKIYNGYNPATFLIDNTLGKFFPTIVAGKRARGGLFKISNEKNPFGEKFIYIRNASLNDTYYISEDLNLFYGLFDKTLLKNNGFKKIMTSYGGSDLKIIERSNLPKELTHYGGSNGIFSSGIYFTHPKNEKLLIPLHNSNNLISSLILEETIRVYEALGAKKILISDVTTINASISAKDLGVEGKASNSFQKEILREKQFGKGIFDPERALENKVFIYDFPAIMTTIEARKRGNQTIENFTENICLSVGLDVEVLNLYKANTNFEYNRKWRFEVEFYDKNEL